MGCLPGKMMLKMATNYGLLAFQIRKIKQASKSGRELWVAGERALSANGFRCGWSPTSEFEGLWIYKVPVSSRMAVKGWYKVGLGLA